MKKIELKEWLSELEGQMRRLSKRVDKLECKHPNTIFIHGFDKDTYSEWCENCDSRIEKTLTREYVLKQELKRSKAQIKIKEILLMHIQEQEKGE